jgi:hypothetical protein
MLDLLAKVALGTGTVAVRHTLRNRISAILRSPSLGYKDLDEISVPTASQFLHCPFPKI